LTVQSYQPASTGPGRIAEGESSGVSMAAENAIVPGQAVKLGTDPEIQVKAWDGAASTNKFAGIAGQNLSYDLDNAQYEQGDPVPVIKKGVVWVKISASSAGVTAGQQAAVLPDGYFTAAPLVVGTSGTYGTEIEDSEYLSSAAAGALAKLSISLPCKTTNVQV